MLRIQRSGRDAFAFIYLFSPTEGHGEDAEGHGDKLCGPLRLLRAPLWPIFFQLHLLTIASVFNLQCIRRRPVFPFSIFPI